MDHFQVHQTAAQGWNSSEDVMGFSYANYENKDTAYCLLGLFGVNKPLIYGEGSKASRRLQEKIHQVIS